MIVAQNVCLGFQAHGIGICYMGTTLHSMTEIGDFLDLPDTCVPVTTIVAGWPDENPDKRDRLPYSAFMHDEIYQRPDEAQLEEIYRQREVRGWARYMAIPELKAKVEALGITSLAQFYTSEIKYTGTLTSKFLVEGGFAINNESYSLTPLDVNSVPQLEQGGQTPTNAQPTTDVTRYRRRLDLLGQLENRTVVQLRLPKHEARRKLARGMVR